MFTLGRCGGLERTDFEKFALWEGVVVLEGVILFNFHRVSQSVW